MSPRPRRYSLSEVIFACLTTGALCWWLTAQADTGEIPAAVPKRITPAPAVDRALSWLCDGVSAPPAVPADCRVPLHGRSALGGEGPENGTAEVGR